MNKSATKRISPLLACMFSCVLLAGCATPKGENDKYGKIDYDPIEPVNRGIFQFNHVIDSIILKPITQAYEAIMPDKGEEMVSSAVDNLHEPVTFANSVLQLDATNSFSTLWRFMINSTVGIGGLFDAASGVGLNNRETGFGDTLAIYGADSGPYIVIPILGPSSVRDGIGRIGDVLSDPITYTKDPVFYSVVGVKTIDTRHRNMKLLNDIYSNSMDPYSTMRSIYTQHRESEIKNAIAERKKSMEAAKLCGKDQGVK